MLLTKLLGIESLEFVLSKEKSDEFKSRFGDCVDSNDRLVVDKEFGLIIEYEFGRMCTKLKPMPDKYIYDFEVIGSGIRIEFKNTTRHSWTFLNIQKIFYEDNNDILCINSYTKFDYNIGRYVVNIVKNVSSLNILKYLSPNKHGNTTWFYGVNTNIHNVYSMEKPMTKEQKSSLNSLVGF